MPRFMQKSIKILMPYVYSRPYVYSFWQICHALRLFFSQNFPGPTFIHCPTSIPDSRVLRQGQQFWLFVLDFVSIAQPQRRR